MAINLEWQHRLKCWRDELLRHFFLELDEIPLEAAVTRDQYRWAEAMELPFAPVAPGDRWGAKWEYGWFRGELTLPDSARGQMISLRMDVGAEAAVYINGTFAGAVDEYHRDILITDSGEPGTTYRVALEAYAGHGPRVAMVGPTPPDRETVPEPGPTQCTIGRSRFGIWQETAYQLWLDVETLWDIRENNDPDSLRVMEIDQGLKDFTLIADFEQPYDVMLETLDQARTRLQPLLEKRNGDTTPEMFGFGHSHIDVAWLWPLAETERKCVRTFSTQLKLMERYPDYVFLQSQPHLYRMVQEKYPDLYEKIEAAVKRGQWIPEGSAWVEPDTNVTSGESLIRQLIHGKRFYKEAFDVDCEMLWLPDVFGYSGALPQIMLGCGVRYFSTQKIFWAYHGGETFPYNTFIWEGIDGSQVKAHFHNDYNSQTRPSLVIERWKERVQKEGFSTRLFPFGWGDGGGGPTRNHIEFARRGKNLEGMPKFRITDPMRFFKAQEAEGWPDERYVGELYFQSHRGTYTSQARTKALNRRSEFALQNAELWGGAAIALAGFEFPYRTWDEAWKQVLLNQFHDILPGSSIHRVYEEAEAQLSAVIDTAEAIAADAQDCLLEEGPSDGVTVFNPLSWPRSGLIRLPEGYQGAADPDGRRLPVQKSQDGLTAEVTVPACGWVGLTHSPPEVLENTLKVEENLLENDCIKVEFNQFGEIKRIFDKTHQRELAAGLCNAMHLYQDVPSAFDAWDIDSMYQLSPVRLPDRAEMEVTAEGPLFARLVIRRKLHHSEMVQTVTLRRGERRMTFETEIDWQERHKLLKVNFPVNVMAHEALHEIQFGFLPRPTHTSRQIDKDRFEVPCQKWSALVEANRGFALLNDSKYGVNVSGNSINLTLLKSALGPDMTADRGRQTFTYAFTFWEGDFTESGLVRQGYELNVPVTSRPGSARRHSLFRLDSPYIILDTVKPAEDGSGDLILRLYESMRTTTRVNLMTTLPAAAVHQADMLENIVGDLAVEDGTITLTFRPFEIKTLRLVLK
jgi:alpha-mannosidase